MSTLIYEDKLPMPRIQNANKVRQVAANLGIDPNWLMQIMNFESAGSFSPSKQSATSNGVGLIQFMPPTAEDLKTSTAALARMTFIEQMDYVEKFYKRIGVMHRVKGPIDMYLATFFPRAVGRERSYILDDPPRAPAHIIARDNPAFHVNNKGYITKGDVEDRMSTYFITDYKGEKKNLNQTKPGGFLTIAGLGILAFIGIKYLK